MTVVQKAIAILVAVTLAVALLAVACRAGAPSYDDATAEKIFAAAEEAMRRVGSFASLHEWTIGTETVTRKNELQDEQNYRSTLTVSDEGAPHPRMGPWEVAVVDGERFAPQAYKGSGSPPTYTLPDDLYDLERLDDATLDDTRVYHLRGTRLPDEETTSGITTVRTSHWTFDLFIDAATLLLVRSEARAAITIATTPEDRQAEEHTYEGFSTTTYSRFGEAFRIVPPPPTPTPTPLPTATPTPMPR